MKNVSRIGAVVAGTSLIAVAATTGATAAKWIDGSDIKRGTVAGKQIKDKSIGSKDIANGKIRSIDIANKGVRLGDLSPWVQKQVKSSGEKGDQGPAGIVAPYVAELGGPTAITSFGGKINDSNTNLETGFDLPAGTYLVTVDGSFMSDAAISTDVDLYPQLSLWIDRNGDEAFQWQDREGDISPNALMPTAADRHISTSGTTVITLEEETHVGLLGFGYAADQSSTGSGEVNVIDATITATPISTN